MKVPFTGGCSCGAIRYEITVEPVTMLKCHCRDCQQLTGSGFSPAVLVPAEAFRLTRRQLRYPFTPSAARWNIFVSDAQPWDHMNPAIPKFEQYPP